MEENKIIELMEKLYIEMQEGFKNVRQEMQEGFKDVRQEMEEGFSAARQERVRIEHTLVQKFDILADGIVQNTNRLDRLEVRVSNIEEMIKERSIIVSQEYYVKLLKKVKNK